MRQYMFSEVDFDILAQHHARTFLDSIDQDISFKFSRACSVLLFAEAQSIFRDSNINAVIFRIHLRVPSKHIRHEHLSGRAVPASCAARPRGVAARPRGVGEATAIGVLGAAGHRRAPQVDGIRGGAGGGAAGGAGAGAGGRVLGVVPG